MANRILETIKGYDNVRPAIQAYVRGWNDCNGENRMEIEPNGLEAYDSEGSGEFFKAECLNINEAESGADEIWQIETGW